MLGFTGQKERGQSPTGGGGYDPVRLVRITFVTIARLNNLETCVRGVAERERKEERGRKGERNKTGEKEREPALARSRMALRSALVVN